MSQIDRLILIISLSFFNNLLVNFIIKLKDIVYSSYFQENFPVIIIVSFCKPVLVTSFKV